MSDWEYDPDDDEQHDNPALLLGDLREGEQVTMTIEAEPELFDSEEYGEGIRVPATFEDSDIAHTTEDGEAIEAGDRVALVSWSKRLRGALTRYKRQNDGLVGDTVSVIKTGTGFDTNYDVRERTEAEA